MVPSNNYKCDTTMLSKPTNNPLTMPLSTTLLIILLRASTTVVKKNGERGAYGESNLETKTLVPHSQLLRIP